MDRQRIMKMIDRTIQQYDHTKETLPLNQRDYEAFTAEIELRYQVEPDSELHEIIEDVIYEFLVG
ncbi:MAG: YqzH family protein [Bacillota bacterium]